MKPKFVTLGNTLQNILKKPLVRNLLLMIFFGILSALLGMLKIHIPGLDGLATDFR